MWHACTHTHTQKHYSTIREWEELAFSTTWLDCEVHCAKWKSQAEKDKYHMISFMSEWVSEWKSLSCVWLFVNPWTIVDGILQAIMKEETDRTGSILKAGLHLGLDCGLWAICPVSMETTYQLENQAPWMEEPQGSYLDSLLPKRIP